MWKEDYVQYLRNGGNLAINFLWHARCTTIMTAPKPLEVKMLESDYVGLPSHTRQFVDRIHHFGLDRVRIHGLFVLVGLCAGAPTTKEKIEDLTRTLWQAIPLDRTRNIDEIVSHVFDGYAAEVDEFCYRSGAEFDFREIKIPNSGQVQHIVELKDHGLFGVDVLSIDRLADASRLYDAFIAAIGRHTAGRHASLIEAFGCGVFQSALYTKFDVAGSMRISELLKSLLPLSYGQYFSTLNGNQIEYFLGLERVQVALLSLMGPIELTYAQQMWGFQSSLFYRDQAPIDGIDDLGPQQWHSWVIQNALEFDSAYPNILVPFSRSDVVLSDIPKWGHGIESFDTCDQYVDTIWGFSASSITSDMQLLEYKALMVHLVYASLTTARDLLH